MVSVQVPSSQSQPRVLASRLGWVAVGMRSCRTTPVASVLPWFWKVRR